MLRRGFLRLTLAAALLSTGVVIVARACGASRAGTDRQAGPPPRPPHAATVPRCFGAASLDPIRHCHNAALGRVVIPPPRLARHLPNAPCRALGPEGALNPCALVAPPPQARATIALVGDSHAEYWRVCVAAGDRAMGW